MLSLAVFTLEDVSILLTGNLVAVRAPRIAFYSLAAALGALFCGLTIFISRPGLHQIVIELLALSMASHAVEHLISMPPTQTRMIAACRIVVSLLVIIPVLRFGYSQRLTTPDFVKSEMLLYIGSAWFVVRYRTSCPSVPVVRTALQSER